MTLSIDVQLERQRERLAALELERASVIARIRHLNTESAAVGSLSVVPDVSTAEGRVALFSDLFRGRPDVFATRWESRTRPGRTGWAPRCANEWVPGVCEKPRVKCAVCKHRRFVALSHAEVRRHLDCSLSMASYDRLFPNQDTMPAGGFGNLIALPLQRERRGDGCTVFLDDALEPFADQWGSSRALLASTAIGPNG